MATGHLHQCSLEEGFRDTSLPLQSITREYHFLNGADIHSLKQDAVVDLGSKGDESPFPAGTSST